MAASRAGRAPRLPALLLAVLAVLLVACGGDEPPRPAPSAVGPVVGSPQPGSGGSPPPGSGGSPAPAPSVAPLSFRGCGDGFSCATLPVPLDERDPAAGSVDLAVVRRPATDRGRRLGSLVVNPGGPGASAVDYLRAAWVLVPAPVRERFDLVAFDPRGVGRSAPVRCATTEELDRFIALDPTPDDAGELRAYEEGNARLASGCARRSGRLLPYVSTRQAAADLDRLRVALGDRKLTYLGYSYGTAIGAAYLDRWPTRVRAMVLDGALDPTLTWDRLLEGQARGFDVALRAFLDDCQRTGCPFREAVRGDLPAAYDRLSTAVDRRTLPGEGRRRVGPGEFTLGVLAGLYSREAGWPALGEALAEAEQGRGAALLALSDAYLERTDRGYAGTSEANVAVTCVDRPWPRETQAYVALAERVRPASPRFGPFVALSALACATWPVPPIGTPRRVRAPSAPPVLVVGTTRDPATPYAWSRALADQLETGVLLTHEGDGHTVYRTGGPDCVLRTVDAYLLTGRVRGALRC